MKKFKYLYIESVIIVEVVNCLTLQPCHVTTGYMYLNKGVSNITFYPEREKLGSLVGYRVKRNVHVI